MTHGYLTLRSTNGDRSNLRIPIENRRALFPVYFWDLRLVFYLPLRSARSGFSFLSMPEGIVLYGVYAIWMNHGPHFQRSLQEVIVKSTPRVSVLWA